MCVQKLLGGGAGPNLFEHRKHCAGASHVSTVADDAGVINELCNQALGCAGSAVQL